VPRPGEDDREAVDRAFADLVAGYHLTSDRPDPLRDQNGSRGPSAPHESAARESAASLDTGSEATPEMDASPSTDVDAPGTAWADSHPLFRYEEPAVAAEPASLDEEFVPEPLMPLPRPAWPVLVAWIAMGYAILAVLAEAMGLKLPAWAGWAALVGFIGGFALLVTRLPRHRDPDAGNGAVL
jgi:hypothetical protein